MKRPFFEREGQRMLGRPMALRQVSAERSGSRGATAGTGRAGCGTTVPWIVKKRSEDRGNLSDDRSQAGALRLEGRIQSVVTTGRRPQHAIHERQPPFTQAVGIRMPNIKPVPEQALSFHGISPKAAPVLQPCLVLIQQSFHHDPVDASRRRGRRPSSDHAELFGPLGMRTISGLTTLEFWYEKIGRGGHDDRQVAVAPSRRTSLPALRKLLQDGCRFCESFSHSSNQSTICFGRDSSRRGMAGSLPNRKNRAPRIS